MAKKNTLFRCSACGATSPKWNGRCESCGEWGTLEEVVTSTVTGPQKAVTSQATLKTIDQVTYSHKESSRIVSHIDEWDRVLGGGLVPGAFVILTGDPGIGKSTILLQVGHAMAQEHKVLYFSSEESLTQIKKRSERIAPEHSPLLFSDICSLEQIIATAQQERPDVVILDSIQNCHISGESSTVPGSVAQLKQSAFLLMQLAKEHNISVIVTGHITKEGQIAGPKVLEHLVDAVFYLQGEDQLNLRILRSVKNRFGTINEVGFFEMTERGLHNVANINELLISDIAHAPGSAITCTLEGSRPLLLEVQALCVPTQYNLPQRVITGAEHKKILLIAAILEKYLHTKFSSVDIFFKVSGGCVIKESASDVAIALALLSSYFQKPLPSHCIGIGEISLTGQIKPVKYSELRISEAKKFGIKNFIVAKNQQYKAGIKTKLVSTVYDLLTFFPKE